MARAEPAGNELRDRIRALVARLAGTEDFDDESVLVSAYETGLLDSFGVIELVSGMEGIIGRELEPTDLTEANFHRFRDVVDLAERRMGGA